MKKIISLSLALILVFSACFCLSSCASVGKSELPSIDSRLVGTWVAEPIDLVSGHTYYALVMFSNGSAKSYALIVDATGETTMRCEDYPWYAEHGILQYGADTWSYSIKGNKLQTTFFNENFEEQTTELTKINEDVFSYFESIVNK